MSSDSGWPNANPEVVQVIEVTPQLPASPDPVENPPWSGRQVAWIGFMLFVMPVVIAPIVLIVVQKVFYKQMSFGEVAQKPWLILAPQFLWFAIMVFYMIGYVEGRFHQGFWSAIRWNWPKRGWLSLIGIGIVTLIALQGMARFLPLPKKSPFDQFFKHPFDAYIFAVLAITFAPFMEELFFRGFLYPVLARRMGMGLGIFFTALPFALIHAFEYKAWAPVLIVFVVGVVVTLVRAMRQSVAASFVVHAIYNGIPIVASFFISGGFRHLDRIK